MSDLQGVGLTMLIGGIAVGGVTSLIAYLAAKRHGPILWRMPIPVISLVVFWVLSLGITITGIVLLAKPEGSHGKHARIAEEVRHV